jgi:hypothetical protein
MNLPTVGDHCTYHGWYDNVVGGILAERRISPLTGNPRYRIVDSAGEMKDPHAGRWVDVLHVIAFDPPRVED